MAKIKYHPKIGAVHTKTGKICLRTCPNKIESHSQGYGVIFKNDFENGCVDIEILLDSTRRAQFQLGFLEATLP